jgi:hypothetical protein
MQAPDVQSLFAVHGRQVFAVEHTGFVPLHAPMSVAVHATHTPVVSLHAGIVPLQSSALSHAIGVSPFDVPPSMLQL